MEATTSSPATSIIEVTIFPIGSNFGVEKQMDDAPHKKKNSKREEK